MRRILKAVGLLFLAVAALSGFITISLPLDFLAAGLLCWFAADF